MQSTDQVYVSITALRVKSIWQEVRFRHHALVNKTSWRDRVKSLGGSGEIGSRDRVTIDQDRAIISWHWWAFVGANYQG